eukprot:g5901.t1
MEPLEEPPKEVRKLSDNFKVLLPPEAERYVSAYKPKDTDVIVVGDSKTGTTWTQHIMHGLRSGGDMQFEEMSEIVPILEQFYKLPGCDIATPQKYQPNMFKSHMLYSKVPKGNAKHIIVVRNPPDVAVSKFHYFADWLFTKGEMSLEEFVEWFYLKPCPPYDIERNAKVMNFIVQAYPHRRDKGVLWLHYEDLKADLKECIKLISDFMDIGVGNQELLNLIEHQSSFDFMKQHKDKFDTGFVKKLTKSELEITSEEEYKKSASKIRKGVIGEGKKEISPEQLKALDAKWKEVVEPICGYATYEEMRAGINKELGRSF